MARRTSLLWTAVLGTTLGACMVDYTLGVWRRAPLSQLPPMDCVRSVLDSTPNIRVVLSRTDTSDRRTVHYFGYEGDRIQALLEFEGYQQKGGMAYKVEQSVVGWNRRPPQDIVDRSRPVMRSIEHDLERRCRVDGLVASVQEQCSWRVKCPPMSAVD